ncbi:MAG: riboflavin synthase [Phycisphaerae bacterium]|jgi:riboflavin synthase|nr:riboflavin synthase [Phycisphaerae bacterium]
MFTGIIQSIGRIVAKSQTPAGARLMIDLGELASQVTAGGSVATNGVCLSAVSFSGSVVGFDVVYETLSRTNLGRLSPGDVVNLEPAMRMSDRIEGHFVLGHVDTTCRITRLEDEGTGKRLTLEVDDPAVSQYIVPKGSVALDGVSLTVASVKGDSFSVALIPTTLENTTLPTKSVGAVLNLETDILVKAVVYRRQQVSESDASLKAALERSGFLG